MASISSWLYTAPVGFDGDTNSSTLVRSVRFASRSATVALKPVDSSVSTMTGTRRPGRSPRDTSSSTGRDEDLVTGVTQHGEGVGHRLLAPVGHEDLVGRDAVAGVALGLGHDGSRSSGRPPVGL